jgi:hypothetical protein
MAFPMEFQIAPRRRAVPETMPWIDEHRAVAGMPRTMMYVADGKMLPV